jgi:hypothetical protein
MFATIGFHNHRFKFSFFQMNYSLINASPLKGITYIAICVLEIFLILIPPVFAIIRFQDYYDFLNQLIDN